MLRRKGEGGGCKRRRVLNTSWFGNTQSCTLIPSLNTHVMVLAVVQSWAVKASIDGVTTPSSVLDDPVAMVTDSIGSTNLRVYGCVCCCYGEINGSAPWIRFFFRCGKEGRSLTRAYLSQPRNSRFKALPHLVGALRRSRPSLHYAAHRTRPRPFPCQPPPPLPLQQEPTYGWRGGRSLSPRCRPRPQKPAWGCSRSTLPARRRGIKNIQHCLR